MQKPSKLLLLLFVLAYPSLLFGQKIEISQADYANQEVEMADIWHQNGKIYVVVAVVMLVFVGLVIYMIAADRKLNKLEKHVRKEP